MVMYDNSNNKIILTSQALAGKTIALRDHLSLRYIVDMEKIKIDDTEKIKEKIKASGEITIEEKNYTLYPFSPFSPYNYVVVESGDGSINSDMIMVVVSDKGDKYKLVKYQDYEDWHTKLHAKATALGAALVISVLCIVIVMLFFLIVGPLIPYLMLSLVALIMIVTIVVGIILATDYIRFSRASFSNQKVVNLYQEIKEIKKVLDGNFLAKRTIALRNGLSLRCIDDTNKIKVSREVTREEAPEITIDGEKYTLYPSFSLYDYVGVESSGDSITSDMIMVVVSGKKDEYALVKYKDYYDLDLRARNVYIGAALILWPAWAVILTLIFTGIVQSPPLYGLFLPSIGIVVAAVIMKKTYRFISFHRQLVPTRKKGYSQEDNLSRLKSRSPSTNSASLSSQPEESMRIPRRAEAAEIIKVDPSRNDIFSKKQ